MSKKIEIPRLLTQYKKEMVPKLKERFGYKNIMHCTRTGVDRIAQ